MKKTIVTNNQMVISDRSSRRPTNRAMGYLTRTTENEEGPMG